MDMPHFHRQQQVPVSKFVVREVRGLVLGEVEAKVTRSRDGHFERGRPRRGRQADRDRIQADGSGDRFREGAAIDVARTVVRRAERNFNRLFSENDSAFENLAYINRLSSLLFILRLFVDQDFTDN